jgi:hypothetical protein
VETGAWAYLEELVGGPRAPPFFLGLAIVHVALLPGDFAHG